MERIEYTAAMKKKFVTWEWNGRGDGNSGIRVVKMARPICEQGCQNGLDTMFRWWETCKHGAKEKDGSPYWRFRQHIKKVDSFEPILDAEGNPTGEYTGTKVNRVYFTLEPNITEIAYDLGIGSGAYPEQFRKFKGFMPLPEVEIAPMCELRGCGKAWPTIRTEFGDYCSETHARFVGARIQHVFLPSNDPKKQREMLRDEVRI